MVLRLRPADRELLELVSAAVSSNPFGEQRHAIDLQLAEAAGTDDRQGVLDRVLARVDARLDALAEGGSLKLEAQPAEVRALLEQALSFSCFHRFADAIDVHIEEQRAAGGQPQPARFAAALLGRLRAHGLTAARATHLLAVFFQMRRAFYFIDRTLTGGSPCMRALRQALWNNIFTHDIGLYDRWLCSRMEDFSTILLGDTGTGKGTAAAAIGRAGFIPFDARRGCFVESFTEAFTAVSLLEFPAGLLESELFGHVKGAFTGAIERYDGALARCSPHGAVFLDEIGEVDVPVQTKLLRVLQEREYSPVGSHEARRFSGRVVAATNRDLDALRRNLRAEGVDTRQLDDVLNRLKQLDDDRVYRDVQELARLQGAASDGAAEIRSRVASAIACGERRTIMRPSNSMPMHHRCESSKDIRLRGKSGQNKAWCLSNDKRPCRHLGASTGKGQDGPVPGPCRKTLGVVLAPPREQVGREIRRRLARPGGRDHGTRGRIGHDHLAIEMPGGVTEQGYHHGKPEEERCRPQNEQHRNDQAPGGHRYRVARNGTERGDHRFAGRGVAIQHHREGDHADAERHQREQESDAAAGDNQPPALRCGQHSLGEVGNSGRSLIAEGCDIHGLCGVDPGHKQREKYRAQAEHGSK